MRLRVDSRLYLAQVIIDDVNDHSPMFPKQIHNMMIPEAAPVNSSWYLPVARDGDSSLFGIDFYELEANTQGKTSSYHTPLY